MPDAAYLRDKVGQMADWDPASFEPGRVPLLGGAGRYVGGHGGDVLEAADGPTVTFDLARSDKHAVTLGGDRTLAVSGDAQSFVVLLKQDGTGGRAVTWWPGARWAGGVAPSLTPDPGKEDVFTFLRRAAGDYMGFVSGLNY